MPDKGTRQTLDLRTLKHLIEDLHDQAAWIEAIEEACKYFPKNIPPEFMKRLITDPKLQHYFSFMLDVPDGTGDLITQPGLWVELPEKGVEEEILWWGLLSEGTYGNNWALAKVTFDGNKPFRRPVAFRVDNVLIGVREVITQTGISPTEIIEHLQSFWLTVSLQIDQLLTEVRSQAACLEFPAILADLKEI